MRRVHWLLAGLALAIGAGALAQVVPGGLPANARFQSVTITNTGAGSFNQFALNATNSTSSNYVALNNAGVTKGVLLNERVASGNCSNDAVDDICLRSISGRVFGSDSTGSGWITLEQSSGPLTWSFQTATSNCSVNGTNAVVVLHRFGKMVIGEATTGGTCTTASTTSQLTTNAPVPATFRPSVQSCGPWIVISTSSVFTPGYLCVNSSGNFVLSLNTGAATTWGTPTLISFTYTLD